MKHAIATLAAAAAWTALAAPPSLAETARLEIGAVERLQKRATATYDGDERNLTLSAPVLFEDALQTGSGARMTSRFQDDSTLTLGENATMVVDRFIYDPEAADRTVVLRNVAGAFLLAVEDMAEAAQNNIEIHTPVAIIGIRGTTVWGGEIDDGYGVLALDGTVTVSTDVGVTTLRPGEGVTIVAPSEPYPVAVWDAAKVARAVATISYEGE